MRREPEFVSPNRPCQKSDDRKYLSGGYRIPRGATAGGKTFLFCGWVQETIPPEPEYITESRGRCAMYLPAGYLLTDR